MLRLIAILFGIAFIFIGVAGFLPTFIHNDLLFGFFAVNLIHNLFFIVSGVIAIMAANSYAATRWYFIIFGLLFALLAILGFFMHGDISFMLIHVNMADNIFHLLIAIAALFLGFSAKRV